MHIPHSDHLASCLEPPPAAEPSAHPFDEEKNVSPVLNSPLECLAPDSLLSPSLIDVPTSAVDQVTSPTVSDLDQRKATPPTVSPTMASLAAASSMPAALCFRSRLPVSHHCPDSVPGLSLVQALMSQQLCSP